MTMTFAEAKAQFDLEFGLLLRDDGWYAKAIREKLCPCEHTFVRHNTIVEVPDQPGKFRFPCADCTCACFGYMRLAAEYTVTASHQEDSVHVIDDADLHAVSAVSSSPFGKFVPLCPECKHVEHSDTRCTAYTEYTQVSRRRPHVLSARVPCQCSIHPDDGFM